MARASEFRHPDIQRILGKVHRGVVLGTDEATRLRHYIDELEGSSSQGPTSFDVPARPPCPASPVITGNASGDGTRRMAARVWRGSENLYRSTQGIAVSSIGIGTHRGSLDQDTDASYVNAIHAALQAGINLIDTSLNYRRQQSERAVAAAVARFVRDGGSRDEIVVCTKGGSVVPEAVTNGVLGPGDVVGGAHCMSPAFLADQIDRSRKNLRMSTIDVYYLHNPETQIEHIGKARLLAKLRESFYLLESAVDDGSIRYYGTATWTGYHDGSLTLPELARVARAAGGINHHFRFIQIPFNLGMPRAIRTRLSGIGDVLDDGRRLGISVVSSASLMHGRLAQGLPSELRFGTPTLRTDAQRAIQFARSTPGILSALVGMRTLEHVTENVEAALMPALTEDEYRRICAAVDGGPTSLEAE